MTLFTLVLYIGIAAVICTGIMHLLKVKMPNLILSFLQNFVGILFVFSGWVKAADPLGTAYKMEQYFTEFESTFSESALSFLAPIFPMLSEVSIAFSVFMVIFEIILGIMIIMGHKPKLSAWLFFLLVVFFTFLTGFTYLTGYVPDGGNFFNFSSWGEYNANNMKVTDCGCFGDFLKLEPKISFFKDVFLLVPGVLFLLFYKKMHQLWTDKTRNIITIVSTVLLLFYCLSNYSWDIPHIDFRPFTYGKDVAAQRTAELDAMANVEIKTWILKHNTDGRTLEIPNAQYMKEFAQYKKDWKVVDQVQTEPTVKKTKISDYEIMDLEGDDITDSELERQGYHFQIISHKLDYDASRATHTVQDTSYLIDTVTVVDPDTKLENIQIVKSVAGVTPREETYTKYDWDPSYIDPFMKVIKPLVESANADKIPVNIVMGGADDRIVKSFVKQTGIEANYQKADDILLKTIVRSNPGIVLWKGGQIVHKWHYKKLPSYSEIKQQYMQ